MISRWTGYRGFEYRIKSTAFSLFFLKTRLGRIIDITNACYVLCLSFLGLVVSSAYLSRVGYGTGIKCNEAKKESWLEKIFGPKIQ